MTLYAFSMMFATNTPAGSQEVEGIMSMIKACTLKSPNLSLQNLDAAVGMRKHLVRNNHTADVKWSTIEPLCNTTVDEACAHMEEGKIIEAP